MSESQTVLLGFDRYCSVVGSQFFNDRKIRGFPSNVPERITVCTIDEIPDLYYDRPETAALILRVSIENPGAIRHQIGWSSGPTPTSASEVRTLERDTRQFGQLVQTHTDQANAATDVSGVLRGDSSVSFRLPPVMAANVGQPLHLVLRSLVLGSGFDATTEMTIVDAETSFSGVSLRLLPVNSHRSIATLKLESGSARVVTSTPAPGHVSTTVARLSASSTRLIASVPVTKRPIAVARIDLRSTRITSAADNTYRRFAEFRLAASRESQTHSSRSHVAALQIADASQKRRDTVHQSVAELHTDQSASSSAVTPPREEVATVGFGGDQAFVTHTRGLRTCEARIFPTHVVGIVSTRSRVASPRIDGFATRHTDRLHRSTGEIGVESLHSRRTAARRTAAIQTDHSSVRFNETSRIGVAVAKIDAAATRFTRAIRPVVHVTAVLQTESSHTFDSTTSKRVVAAVQVTQRRNYFRKHFAVLQVRGRKDVRTTDYRFQYVGETRSTLYRSLMILQLRMANPLPVGAFRIRLFDSFSGHRLPHFVRSLEGDRIAIAVQPHITPDHDSEIVLQYEEDV